MNKKSLCMMNIIEHFSDFSDFFLGETKLFDGKMEH